MLREDATSVRLAVEKDRVKLGKKIRESGRERRTAQLESSGPAPKPSRVRNCGLRGDQPVASIFSPPASRDNGTLKVEAGEDDG
jgi:hypothetical protein